MKIKTTLICAGIMLCGIVYAASPFTNDATANPCEQIRMQCKSNAISASDCMQQLEQCYQQVAQQHQQQLESEKTDNMNTLNQAPQGNIMTDGQPEAPVDDGKTTPKSNPHPAWHFGN